MKKKLFITTLTLAAILLVGGCGQSTAAETTAPAEETAEAEAETVPTPEPSPTAEPTPEPVVELADDEILQAAHDAFMAQNKFTVTETVSNILDDEDPFDMERTIYVDFDKNLITYNAPDIFSSVCANPLANMFWIVLILSSLCASSLPSFRYFSMISHTAPAPPPLFNS